ncbi:hypothetical protein DL93DRAFT_2075719 [Clavulina sp. PMI_390]|nr:hypothetical protein DL93DRAFT_2075719 [Clavulina sp. PMI_390]
MPYLSRACRSVDLAIAQHLGATKVVGVDIDSALVAAAWKRRRYLWSLSAPLDSPPPPPPPPSPRGAGRKRKREQDDHNSSRRVPRLRTDPFHFPISMQHLYGPLPVPTPRPEPDEAKEEDESSTSFPHNLSFRTEDWLMQTRVEQYQVILAFSITKWVHLNHGDDGLLRFFQRCFDSLEPQCGAKLVLEPQHWEGYAKAKRMDPVSFPLRSLRYRSLTLSPTETEENC